MELPKRSFLARVRKELQRPEATYSLTCTLARNDWGTSMRQDKHLRYASLRWQAWYLLAVAFCGTALIGADPASSDPVEDLRQALTSSAPDRNLEQRVQALRGLTEMRSALGLGEWSADAPEGWA